ncbi:precorrin-2 dehydrogenase/sirohydrochlorin ferrochelatase family protein [Listeria rustica]|uniref:precorrin-2 dehydrogenase n=1 Tax=Listeria rustica TaxID=2713503 RepID=A0A7W1YGP1_9LIST|nr:bifunctional precorrin-2 dehydrogenase/sirohydrochlorin ferrochelatase [Listeria rustica]MBA3926824.1 bifunctional precorrin-2 dehydrogenase/sirohydrochlorin ferrochelatase [Listeria rustica]
MSYPVLLQLTDKNVTIIGGGKIATRKARGLLTTGANITVVAPTFTEELHQMSVHRIQANYQAQHLSKAFLIFCCTNDSQVNAQIIQDASPQQLINDCTDKSRSDFFNMATLQQEDHLIAISTNGNNPTRAKEILQKIRQSADN